MSWSNCKVELKLKWTKYCVLSAGGADNENANSNNIIFSIKVTKLYAPIVILLEKTIKNFSKFLSKEFERSVYWSEYKAKTDNESTANQYRHFLELNFAGVKRLFVLVYTNQDANAKRFNARKYYLPKGIIKSYNINRKNFMSKKLIQISNDMEKL